MAATENLLRLNRLVTLGQLVRGTAHSLNNSLQAIAGATELLGRHEDLPESVGRMIGRIAKQCAKATSEISNLVTLSRADTGAPEPIDLRHLVSHAVALRQNMLARSQIRIVQAQEVVGAFPVRGHAAQLQLVVLNLLLNAEQALAGRADGVIHITLDRRGDRVRVTLADNGRGIPADLQPRIFDPFFSTGAAGAAAGLGLTVARLIVESHGGSLVLEGSDPSGSRFAIELPADGAGARAGVQAPIPSATLPSQEAPVFESPCTDLR
ncbi:MAG: HAMP domain-containing histidine kinase [Acidobacteria bacterium]|nr:HAMP domain-containing histidine kinase [Acidobacteriota bacterium]